MNDVPKAPALETRSRVIHWAFWYDVMLKVRSLGRENRVRDKFLDLAKVGPGQSILDAGCGTGTMAIAARRRVGAAGNVCAVDASPEMIARARQKAARQGADIHFETALLEALPFPDAKFDVVPTSFVLHHFPADLCSEAWPRYAGCSSPTAGWSRSTSPAAAIMGSSYGTTIRTALSA